MATIQKWMKATAILGLWMILSVWTAAVYAQAGRPQVPIAPTGAISTAIKSFSTSGNTGVFESGQNPAGMITGGGVGGAGMMEAQIRVHVIGEVEKPGVYRISISDRVTDAIGLASPKRTLTRKVVVKNPAGDQKSFDLYAYYYRGDLGQNPYLEDNSVIVVPPHQGLVRIDGAVARPGSYELMREKNVWDIVQLAGGFSGGVSDVNPVKLIRFKGDGQKEVLDVAIQKGELQKVKIMKGDLLVAPDRINSPDKFDYSIEEIPGENVVYPTSTPTVFVIGQVTQAGGFPYKSNLYIKDYVSYASPSSAARIGKMSVLRNDKKIRLGYMDKPNPGDVIIVKSKFNPMTAVGIASTFLSVTLSALVVNEYIK